MIIIIITISIFVNSCDILVGQMIIDGLLFRFAPGIIATEGLRLVGIHVAARPFRAGRQSEVDEVRVVVVGTNEIGWCVTLVQDDIYQYQYVRERDLAIVIQIGC